MENLQRAQGVGGGMKKWKAEVGRRRIANGEEQIAKNEK